MIYEKYPQWEIDVEKGTVYSLRLKRFIGSVDSKGYVRLGITKNGYIMLHQLIWGCVNGEIPNGYVVHHKDYNPLNNSIYNLELMSLEEHNSLHHTNKLISSKQREAISKSNTGKPSPTKGKKLSEETKKKISESLKGENNPFYGKHHTEDAKRKIKEKNSKKVAQYTMGGELIKIWNSAKECETYGFDRLTIGKCCRGKYKHHKGYIWEYYNEEKDAA